jgi:acyl-CoA reductase-like NAD-dependent aldehyde dehydrogenase
VDQLGGKSPVIVASCADVNKVVKRMLSVKQMGIGQMCGESDSQRVAVG